MKGLSFPRYLGVLVLTLLLPGWVLAAGEKPDVLFIPFQQVGQASSNGWVSQALQEALVGEIAKDAGSPAKTLDHPLANSDAAAAISAGQDANARMVVYGSYQIADNQIRVNAQAVTIADKKVVATLKATGDLRDLFKIEDLLTYQIKAAFPKNSDIDPTQYFNDQQRTLYLDSVGASLSTPDISTTRPVSDNDIQASDNGAVAEQQTDPDSTVATVDSDGEILFTMEGPALYSQPMFQQFSTADQVLPYLPATYSYTGGYDLGYYPNTVYPFAYGFTPGYFFNGVEFTGLHHGRFGFGRTPLASVPRVPFIGNFGRPFVNPYFAYAPAYWPPYSFGPSYYAGPLISNGFVPPLSLVPHFSFTYANGPQNFPQQLSSAPGYYYAPAYGYAPYYNYAPPVYSYGPAYNYAPSFGFGRPGRLGVTRSFGLRAPMGAPRGFSVFGTAPLNATGNFVGSRASGR